MRTLNIRLRFLFDDGMVGVGQYRLTIPETTSDAEVFEILQKEHDFLCSSDERERYKLCGKTPDTLLECVREKYKWEYNRFHYDIDMSLM